MFTKDSSDLVGLWLKSKSPGTWEQESELESQLVTSNKDPMDDRRLRS